MRDLGNLEDRREGAAGHSASDYFHGRARTVRVFARCQLCNLIISEGP